MLCASILLAPLSLAMSLSDFHYDVGVGQKCVTLGDPTDNKSTIFGSQANTATDDQIKAADGLPGALPAGDNGMVLNGEGISRSVGYCAPVVTGALGFKLTNNFKIGTELHISSSNKIYLNDVVSNVSNISYELTASSDDSTAIAEATILETAGGKNDLYVEPKFGVTFKAEYQFGADSNGATLGLAVARSTDEFIYSADVLRDDRQSDKAELNAPEVQVENDFDWTEVGVKSNHHLKDTALTTEKYDEAGFWVGAVASASAEITESVLLKVGAGYYMRDFDASKNDSNGVHFLVSSTESTMSMFNVSVTMSA